MKTAKNNKLFNNLLTEIRIKMYKKLYNFENIYNKYLTHFIIKLLNNFDTLKEKRKVDEYIIILKKPILK